MTSTHDQEADAIHASFGEFSKCQVAPAELVLPAPACQQASGPAMTEAPEAENDALEESFGARGRPSYYDHSIDQAIEDSFAGGRAGLRR